MRQPNGILPLLKPKGMTSHDCVNVIRKLFNTKKVGHTGTLDPSVEGVLPICIGRATKVVPYLTDTDKTYEGVVSLGASTDTEDADGTILSSKPVDEAISRDDVIRVMESMTGTITQRAPMYSAVKVNGKKLYEYAREGIEVERPLREVAINQLTLLSQGDSFLQEFAFRVSCSKGTYVRTIAVDMGDSLGYPAHLKSLIRTKAGAFSLDDCSTFDVIKEKIENEQEASLLVNMDHALRHLPSLLVNCDNEEAKVKNGAVLPKPEGFPNSLVTVYNSDGECLAIYKPHPEKEAVIKPERVFATN